MAPSYKSDKYVGDVDSDSDHEIEFAPPKHYHQVDASKKFKNQINDNKEIWLIKTPKNFPISKLKSLPVSFTSTSITNGPKTFDLGEKNYQVNEENLSNNEEVRKYSLIANRKIVSNKKIDRFYHISEYVNIPKINYDQVKTPRENVKVIENLKMRHFPTGYSSNDYNSNDYNSNDHQDEKILKKTKIEKKEKKEKKDKKKKSKKD